MSNQDVAPRTDGEAMRFPSEEELRMVRAIALLALLDAARHGEYRATFRGFRVHALRQRPAPDADAFVEVNLCVSLGRAVIERSVLATTDAEATEPKP